MSRAQQLRRLARDAVDEVEPGVATPAARSRRKASAGSACAVRPSTARSSGEKLCTPSEMRTPRGAPAPPALRRAPAAHAGERVVGVLRVGLDGHLGVRREVRPEELEQPLEPVRPQQTRGAAAEVQRVEAAHVVRRPLALPLGGDAVHVRVEPAGHLRPGPPAGRRSTASEANSQ